MYQVVFSRQAQKDKARLKQVGLEARARELLRLLMQNPYETPPRYEKLVGDLKGMYSRRINMQHRLIYDVDETTKTVRVLRMWTHYGDN